MPDTQKTPTSGTQSELPATRLRYVNGKKQLAEVKVSGEQRAELDARGMAEVVVMLAREIGLMSKESE
ncbi:MAG TPA: hypothetical protein VFO38_04270 [Candidatus Saccharimonadales bacterium]|nr:hypothetical protein [Candidatus Saccharimonadales bacterium]